MTDIDPGMIAWINKAAIEDWQNTTGIDVSGFVTFEGTKEWLLKLPIDTLSEIIKMYENGEGPRPLYGEISNEQIEAFLLKRPIGVKK